jgi:effector-binding domain-containing protein
VEVGVQVATPFTAQGEVVPTETPAGRVAHAVHYGDYGELPGVHRALRTWVTGQGLRETGDDWEVYGDMHEDPAQRRTDVYHLLAQG